MWPRSRSGQYQPRDDEGQEDHADDQWACSGSILALGATSDSTTTSDGAGLLPACRSKLQEKGHAQQDHIIEDTTPAAAMRTSESRVVVCLKGCRA